MDFEIEFTAIAMKKACGNPESAWNEFRKIIGQNRKNKIENHAPFSENSLLMKWYKGMIVRHVIRIWNIIGSYNRSPEINSAIELK